MQNRGSETRSVANHNEHGALNSSIPREAMDAIRFIQNEFRKPVWLLGLRGLYSLGVPVHRSVAEVIIYSPITKSERSKLDDYLRDKYEKLVGRRSDRGTTYSFPHGCLLEVNRVDDYIEKYYNSSIALEPRRTEIDDDVYILIPQIEDLLVMKLITSRTKDLRDIREIIRTSRSKIDMNKLKTRARENEVELKLKRIQRIA